MMNIKSFLIFPSLLALMITINDVANASPARPTAAPLNIFAARSSSCTPFSVPALTSTAAQSQIQDGFINFSNGTSCQQLNPSNDQVLCCPNYYGIPNSQIPDSYMDPNNPNANFTNSDGLCIFYGDDSGSEGDDSMQDIPCNDNNKGNPLNSAYGIQSNTNTTTITVGYCATLVINATQSVFTISSTPASTQIPYTMINGEIHLTNNNQVTVLTGGSTKTFSISQSSLPNFCTSSTSSTSSSSNNKNSSISQKSIKNISLQTSLIVVIMTALIFGMAIIQ